jgi:hypothetical protein
MGAAAVAPFFSRIKEYSMDYDNLGDALGSSFSTPDYGVDFGYGVGPQSDGTYQIPNNAQPSNQQWDTGGGTRGSYGGDVLGILRDGVGAWSQYQRNNQFLDYQRFEATQGGVFRQGAPNQYTGAVAARATIDPMLLILMAGAAYLLLRK